MEDTTINKNNSSERWYKLDNSAVIYPMSITATTQSLFRLSAEMKDYIDSESLTAAVKSALTRYPGFAVQLRSGFFHYYFDSNDYPPVIKEDNGILFQKIDFNKNNRYLFRISYYKKRIFIDFFHALCDATGGMEFLKTIIYCYLLEIGEKPSSHENIKIAGELPKEGEIDDGFVKYYKPFDMFGGVLGKMAGKDAYQITGKRFKRIGYGLIQGSLPIAKVKALAKKYDCTVTVLISAIALLAVYRAQKTPSSTDNMVAMIPVDLRRIFPCNTIKNFTTVARVSLPSQSVSANLEEYTRFIKESLAKELDKDVLQEKLSATTLLGRKWYLRMVPLPIKSFLIKTGKMMSVKTKQTMIISNLGVVKMPNDVGRFVKELAFAPNVSKKVPINMGVVSFGENLVVSFTYSLISTEIQRQFFRIFTDVGFSSEDIKIIANFR